MLSLVIAVWLSAVLGGAISRFGLCYKRWAHHKEGYVVLFKIHTWLARIIVVFGYIACTTGLVAYYRTIIEPALQAQQSNSSGDYEDEDEHRGGRSKSLNS